jgi:hypothetical protein
MGSLLGRLQVKRISVLAPNSRSCLCLRPRGRNKTGELKRSPTWIMGSFEPPRSQAGFQNVLPRRQ